MTKIKIDVSTYYPKIDISTTILYFNDKDEEIHKTVFDLDHRAAFDLAIKLLDSCRKCYEGEISLTEVLCRSKTS